MSSYYSEQNTKRNSISTITAQLERDLYYLQCAENYQLDSRKMILDNNTLIILGSLDNDLFRKKIFFSKYLEKKFK